MNLSGQQRRLLQSALMDAFPTLASLEQMLAFGLEKNLRAIAGEGSLQEIVFKLIQTAEAQGWLENLIDAARKENPRNSQLEVIASRLLSLSTTSASISAPTAQSQLIQQKILILAANPIGTSQLRLDEELREIEQGLRRARQREQFEIKSALAARLRDIHRSILEFKPQIVHFSGHGSGQDGLVFTDETGERKLVDGAALARLFKLFKTSVNCVVLNACYSEIQARAIAQHINYVVGMSQAVGDRAAIEFAVGFYDALWAGEKIEFAHELGCTLIQMQGISEQLTPKLLKKQSDSELSPRISEVNPPPNKVIEPRSTTNQQHDLDTPRNQNPLANLSVVNTLTGHSEGANAVPISTDNEPYAVSAVPITPDGKTFVSASNDATSKVWNLETGQLLRTLTGHRLDIYSAVISPDGQTLVTSSRDHTINVWNLETGQLLHTLRGHSNTVAGVGISPNGQTLVSSSYDKTINIWNLATGNLIRTLSGYPDWFSGSIAFSPDGQTLAIGSYDRTIKIWHLAAGNLIRTLNSHSDTVCSVAISPDGQTLVSSSYDKTIKIWHLATGNLIRTLSDHSDVVWNVAISTDGQTLASASQDKTIKIWHLATGSLISTLDNSTRVHSVAISPDGQTLVSGNRDGTIKIWRGSR